MYFREDCFVFLFCLGFLFCFVCFFSSPWKERKNQRTCETESERRPCVGFMSTICRLLRFGFSSASKIVAWHVKVGALALPSSITREALENCKSATAYPVWTSYRPAWSHYILYTKDYAVLSEWYSPFGLMTFHVFIALSQWWIFFLSFFRVKFHPREIVSIPPGMMI